MKKTFFLLTLAASAAVAVMLMTGCAHFAKKSTTAHERVVRAVALPPGWTLVAATDALNLPLTETATFLDHNNLTAVTNFTAGFFAPRPTVFDVIRESWTDTSKGGGTFLFTDPQASQVASTVGNQAALAGAHTFNVGSMSSTISSNAVAAINATGNSVGNIIGAAAKAASGTP